MRIRVATIYYIIVIAGVISISGCKTEPEEQKLYKINYECDNGYTYCEKDFFHSNYERVLYDITLKNKDSLVIDIYTVGMCYDSISASVKITENGLELNYSFIADESIDYEECDCVFQINVVSYLVPKIKNYHLFVNNQNIENELSKKEFTTLFDQFVSEYCIDFE